LADHPEFQPRVPEPGPSLSDSEVGASKASGGLLALGPRFDRLTVAAGVAFQLVVLIAMILGRTVPFLGTQTVLLHVEPVDPRDLFRGDYVTLGYAINRTPARGFAAGQSVYVTLVPEADGRHFRAGQFLANPPASGVFIRGTSQGYGRVTYGIESFYVQEGTGHDYEKAVQNHRLWAEVALDRQGNPALRQLVIE
jgi:uncharacterized membrane-anchored protein